MPPKMIMHIIPSLDIGGTEKQLLVILPQLEKTIHSEVVCLMGHGPAGKALQEQNIPVHYLDGRGLIDLRMVTRLWRLLRRRPRATVVTYLIYADILGRIVGRLAGIQTIITSHRSSLFGPAWWHQVDRFTRWLVTQYTSQTEATKKLLHQVVRVPMNRITVIPNAVEYRSRLDSASIRQKLGISLNALVVICVANLKPEKDLALLLQVFAALPDRHPRLHLWLVGEGPERDRLQRQITSYQSKSRIHLLGLRADVPAILTEADIFVLPTRIEGMSNALLEALAAGLPCLVSDIPANQAVITPGKNGLLFKTGDAESLRQQLEYLLASSPLRQELGQSARTYVTHTHSPEAVVNQWHKLFNQLS